MTIQLYDRKVAGGGAMDITESKKKILRDAIDVLYLNGYHGTNIRELSKAAGLAKSTFYSHFERWRNMVQHRMCQMEGRNALFESYKITVAKSIREYSLKDRKHAPQDLNQYFEDNR